MKRHDKHIDALSEKRQNPSRGFVENGGYKVKVRPQRCKRRLPDGWGNAEPRWQRDHRCWKRYRNNQYKVLKESKS